MRNEQKCGMKLLNKLTLFIFSLALMVYISTRIYNYTIRTTLNEFDDKITQLESKKSNAQEILRLTTEQHNFIKDKLSSISILLYIVNCLLGIGILLLIILFYQKFIHYRK